MQHAYQLSDAAHAQHSTQQLTPITTLRSTMEFMEIRRINVANSSVTTSSAVIFKPNYTKKLQTFFNTFIWKTLATDT